MDVLYHLTLCTLAFLEQQQEQLLKPGLFELGVGDGVQQEGEEVFGPKFNDPIVAPAGKTSAEEDDSKDVNQEIDLHNRFV